MDSLITGNVFIDILLVVLLILGIVYLVRRI